MNRRIILFTTIVLTIAFNSYAGKYDVAIIIANSEYQDEAWESLNYTAADFKMMKDFANQLGYAQTVEYQNIGKNKLERVFAVELQPMIRTKSRVLIYYSGHGAIDEEGRLYLVPVDSYRDVISRNAYPMASLKESLNDLIAKEILLIVDSCYSGPPGKGDIEARPEEADFDELESVIYLASARGTQKSIEHPDGGRSLFTDTLLRGWRDGYASQDGKVQVGPLMNWVRDEVWRMSAHKQEPTYCCEEFEGFVLQEGVYPPTATPTRTPTEPPKSPTITATSTPTATVYVPTPDDKTKADKALWYTLEQKKTKAAAVTYLDVYPNGRHKAEAEMTLTPTDTPTMTPTRTPTRTPTPSDFEMQAFDRAKKAGCKEDYEGFIGLVPDSQFVPTARALMRRAPERTQTPSRTPTRTPTRTATPTPDPRGTRAGQEWTEPYTGMVFVYVPKGTFEMGCGSWQSNCYDSENPVHTVTLTKGFWLGKYEVTQGQWKKVMGKNPSYFSGCGDSCPVEQISWNDCQEFIRELKTHSNYDFRLPMEAEWEYASRSGGKAEKYSGGSDIDTVAWYWDNSSEKTHSVGQKQPNGLGLYDMSGNVWEWCQDWYQSYTSSPVTDPIYDAGGSYRVIRGGSWNLYARYCRSADRGRYSPDYRSRNIGFRLARTP